MFSKSKDGTASAPPAPILPGRVAQASAPSIISADLAVMGALISRGDIQIDGTVEGDVRGTDLVIGEKAEVRGDIAAEEVNVRGRVIGRIRARKVQLAATCHVEGDILHETFSVETGAFFEGNCRHCDDPLGAGAQSPPALPQKAAPSPHAPHPVAEGVGTD